MIPGRLWFEMRRSLSHEVSLADTYFRDLNQKRLHLVGLGAVTKQALVNEAYLRLVGDQARDWRNRAHFIGVSASIMRRDPETRSRLRAFFGDVSIEGYMISGSGYRIVCLHTSTPR